jgi:hypothetical protein
LSAASQISLCCTYLAYTLSSLTCIINLQAHTDTSGAGNHAGSASAPAVSLDVADLPHHDATKPCSSEEWSLHAHFNGADGQPQSASVSFTRYAKAPGVYGYGLQAALSDVQSQSYVHEALLDRDMPARKYSWSPMLVHYARHRHIHFQSCVQRSSCN